MKGLSRNWKKVAAGAAFGGLLVAGGVVASDFIEPEPDSDHDKDGIPYQMEKECPEEIFGTDIKNCPDINMSDLYVKMVYSKDFKPSDNEKKKVVDIFKEAEINLHIIDGGTYKSDVIDMDFILKNSAQMCYNKKMENRIDSVSDLYYRIFVADNIFDDISDDKVTLGKSNGVSTAFISGYDTKIHKTFPTIFSHEVLHFLMKRNVPEEYQFIDDGKVDPAHTKWKDDILYPKASSHRDQYIRPEIVKILQDRGTVLDCNHS